MSHVPLNPHCHGVYQFISDAYCIPVCIQPCMAWLRNNLVEHPSKFHGFLLIIYCIHKSSSLFCIHTNKSHKNGNELFFNLLFLSWQQSGVGMTLAGWHGDDTLQFNYNYVGVILHSRLIRITINTLGPNTAFQGRSTELSCLHPFHRDISVFLSSFH